jgi:hypothetical protein
VTRPVTLALFTIDLLSSLTGPDNTLLAHFDVIDTEAGLDYVLIGGSYFEHVGDRGTKITINFPISCESFYTSELKPRLNSTDVSKSQAAQGASIS